MINVILNIFKQSRFYYFYLYINYNLLYFNRYIKYIYFPNKNDKYYFNLIEKQIKYFAISLTREYKNKQYEINYKNDLYKRIIDIFMKLQLIMLDENDELSNEIQLKFLIYSKFIILKLEPFYYDEKEIYLKNINNLLNIYQEIYNNIEIDAYLNEQELEYIIDNNLILQKRQKEIF